MPTLELLDTPEPTFDPTAVLARTAVFGSEIVNVRAREHRARPLPELRARGD